PRPTRHPFPTRRSSDLAIGGALHLVGRDAAARHRAGAGGAASVGEPGALGRRVHLGAHPDVVLAGVGVDLLHQLARLVRKPWARSEEHTSELQSPYDLV